MCECDRLACFGPRVSCLLSVCAAFVAFSVCLRLRASSIAALRSRVSLWLAAYHTNFRRALIRLRLFYTMPSCAQVPFRVPSIPATAATYRQHYRRYRQHYRRYRQHYHCYRRRRRSDRCCRPPGRATGTAPPPLPPLLRRWQLPPTATAALPLPTSPTVVSSAIVAVPPSPLPYAGMS